MAIKRKKIIRKIPKTGLNAVPFDKGFQSTLHYFQYNIEKKEVGDIVKTYIKNNYSKSDARFILSNPDWKFSTYSHYGCVAYWLNTNTIFEQDIHCKKMSQDILDGYVTSFKNYLTELIEPGKILLEEKKLKEKEKGNVVVLSPQQRLQNKIGDTIIQDLLELEDQWIEGKETSLNVYEQFKLYGLSGSATLPVQTMVEGWLLDYEDAFYKRCDQAVEGYAHLNRSELNRRINECHSMLNDLSKIKLATKALRKVKIKKVKSADKQVKNLKYKKEDNDFKIVSINPVQVIGSVMLYTFNTKYKVLTQYITQAGTGFEISGSTIKNFSKEDSRSIKLRKPDQILPIVLSKSQTQINKEWDKLTTKTFKPNGRLNKETILLRVK
tara:strand:- start:1025 stop:2170 length:1146 start_codon:yes stop_codon:yes gene_type:complete